MNSDPRLTPARDDLAAEHLRGQVRARKFAKAKKLRVGVPVAPLCRAPDPGAGMDTQLLYGEGFDAYETDGEWAWGQSAMDGYVGYVPRACLEARGAAPTHRVTALMSHVYPKPDIKTAPIGQLSYGALLRVEAVAQGFAILADGGFAPARHVVSVKHRAKDWVAEAERFVGVPYLWGGRSSTGLDCSALMQLALQAAGVAVPRDSDQQINEIGDPVEPGSRARRGDLIFWKGHVGVMVNGSRLLHANAHHMTVAIEPFVEVRNRIRIIGEGPVTGHSRINMRSARRVSPLGI